MYMYNFLLFFPFGHISSWSHLCPKRRVVWAQFDRRAHVAGGLGAIRAVCRAWQAFQTFLALGTLKANPRASATSPGIGFLHTLSPCTHVRFGCKPGFSARRGYTHISLFLHRQRAPRYVPAYQHQSNPPSSSSLQLYARAAAVVVGDYFDRSLRCSLTSVFVFLRRSQMADSRQRAESKTLQVGPCACACCILSLRRRVAFYCHSICHVLLSSRSLLLNTCRISRHTCPFSLLGGP